MKWLSTEVTVNGMGMAAPLYKLHCLLKRAQMLLLCLGIAYLMAGSILLLQRSSIRIAQSNPPAGLPPMLSLAAPPTALRTAGLGMRARSRWAAIQSAPGGGAKAAGRHWPASRSLGVQHLHRRWFHSLVPESPEQRVSLHRSSTHKGKELHRRRKEEENLASLKTYIYLCTELLQVSAGLLNESCSFISFTVAKVNKPAGKRSKATSVNVILALLH